MSKERLEEIRQRLVLIHNAADVDDETKSYIFEYLKVEWLIERVQELERQLEFSVNHVQEISGKYRAEVESNINLKKQNKRYREALEFYGNKFNHMQTMDSFADSGRGPSIVMQDCGLKARKALSE